MKRKFELEVADSGTAAYLRLPSHPGMREGFRVSKTVQLVEVLGSYDGPELLFDFGPDGVLVGIEILVDEFEEPDY